MFFDRSVKKSQLSRQSISINVTNLLPPVLSLLISVSTSVALYERSKAPNIMRVASRLGLYGGLPEIEVRCCELQHLVLVQGVGQRIESILVGLSEQRAAGSFYALPIDPASAFGK